MKRKLLTKLAIVTMLAATLTLAAEAPDAEATVTLYTCGIDAENPTAGGGWVQGTGEGWCQGGGQLVSGSKVCLRRHKSWSGDWQGACKNYTVNAWGQRFVSSHSTSLTGSKKYRTRQYGRFDSLACGCPTYTLYDESSWVQF